MSLKDLLKDSIDSADVVAVKKKNAHKYADEAQAVREALESKDDDALAEALELFFKNCDHDLDEEDDGDE